jgi:hypothetical protein
MAHLYELDIKRFFKVNDLRDERCVIYSKERAPIGEVPNEGRRDIRMEHKNLGRAQRKALGKEVQNFSSYISHSLQLNIT